MPARTHQEQCGGEGTREREREREKTKRDGRGESGRSSARITKVEKKGCWNEGGWSERRRRKKNRVLLIIRLEMLVLRDLLNNSK